MTTPRSDLEIQERDRTARAERKKHADNKRYIKPSTVKEDDTVFVKRDDSKKKSDTPYDTRPFIVVEKKLEAMVTAQDDDGAPVTRNSSVFKSFPATAEDRRLSREIRKGPADVTDTSGVSGTPLRRYPQRMRTRPVGLDDYVCG